MREITDGRATRKLRGSTRNRDARSSSSVPCTIIPIGLRVSRPYNLAMRQLRLPALIEADAEGYFVSCPALQGCHSQGDTYDKAIANIEDAIRLHLDDRNADGGAPNQKKR
jgi:predicted RNase H-like HicB family nuclease